MESLNNKPILKYCVTCDSIKEKDGKLSFIGLFDTIKVYTIPAMHEKFFVGVSLTSGIGTFSQQIRIVDSEGTPVIETPASSITLKDENSSSVTVMEIQGFPIIKEGIFKIEIRLNEKTEYTIPFTVKQIPVPKLKEYSEEELKKLLTRPNIIKHARAEVTCPVCNAKYVFQKNLDPKPIENEYRCTNCQKFVFDLKPVRASIITSLGKQVQLR